MCALLLSLFATALTITPAVAATPADDYTNATLRTLAFVQFAEKGDEPSVAQAIAALQPIAASQPEILNDLRQAPPLLEDADARLGALLGALRGRADVPDPSGARAALHDVLAMPRYAGLSAAPPWWQQALSWLLQQIGRLLSLIGAGHLVIPPLVYLIGAVVVLGAVAAWLLRSLTSRVGGGGRRAAGTPVIAAVDYFALADRAAAAGDYAAALRALAGAVAVALGGERVWVSSPLTVREIFQRAKSPPSLRPLLRSFEAQVYGHRPTDAATYTAMAQVAAPFREARP